MSLSFGDYRVMSNWAIVIKAVHCICLWDWDDGWQVGTADCCSERLKVVKTSASWSAQALRILPTPSGPAAFLALVDLTCCWSS